MAFSSADSAGLVMHTAKTRIQASNPLIPEKAFFMESSTAFSESKKQIL